MTARPKFNYFRSRKHLINVAALPCQNCYTEGQTQASHSNWSVHGKAKSLKASDEFVAALCQKCHYEVDQGKTLSKEEKSQMWHNAFVRTKVLLRT